MQNVEYSIKHCIHVQHWHCFQIQRDFIAVWWFLFCKVVWKKMNNYALMYIWQNGPTSFLLLSPSLSSFFWLANAKVGFILSCDVFHTIPLLSIPYRSIRYFDFPVIWYQGMGVNIITNWDHWCFYFICIEDKQFATVLLGFWLDSCTFDHCVGGHASGLQWHPNSTIFFSFMVTFAGKSTGPLHMLQLVWVIFI